MGGVNGLGGGVAAAVAEAPVATTTTAPRPAPIPPVPIRSPSSASTASADDDELSPELRQCVGALREGKRLLKEKQGAGALVRFERALMLAEGLGDSVHEKRAVRGLAASARLLGDRRAAIAHLQRVLAISREQGDYVGDADACGNIADLYTELGMFEKAAEYYDRYISRMATDGPV